MSLLRKATPLGVSAAFLLASCQGAEVPPRAQPATAPTPSAAAMPTSEGPAVADSAHVTSAPVLPEPEATLPAGAVALRFLEPVLCDLPTSAPPPPTLRDFDWCAFVKGPQEIWKDPKRRHACTRANTPEEKKACVSPDRYELLGVAYADVVPPPRLPGASLCDGDEALLLLRVDGDGGPRLLVQARCASNFPPDPLRAGLNGEFQLPAGVDQATWFLVGAEVGAVYERAGQVCQRRFWPERSSVARYGGTEEESCSTR